jgi:plasmid stabilization system protein ParE
VRIVWHDEAIDDLEEIVAYYWHKASPIVAELVQESIVSQIENLKNFPLKIRASERVEGARELVMPRLPYIAFVRVTEDTIQVLNIVHTARKFPL